MHANFTEGTDSRRCSCWTSCINRLAAENPHLPRQAHRNFLQFSRSRKKTAKKIRKAVGKQLCYLARNLAAKAEQFREREEHYPSRILVDKSAEIG